MVAQFNFLNFRRLRVLLRCFRVKVRSLLVRSVVLKGLFQGRRQERMMVQAQVMLKKTIATDQSPIGAWVQYLQEGSMLDFSKGGAQISLGQEWVQQKDFLNLMYKNRHGIWVSVESQVRWVTRSSDGIQIIGVQFLAMST